MINSLSRDSHMAPALANTQVQAKSSVSTVKLHKNASATPAMGHDQVSFGGVSAARLANQASAKKVYKLAAKFLKENKEKVTPKTVGALVSDIAEKVVQKDALEVSKVADVVSNLKPESNAAKFANQLLGDTKTANVLDDFFGKSAKFIKESQKVSSEVKDIIKDEKVVDFEKVAKNFKITKTQKLDVDGKVVKEIFENEFADAIKKDAKVAMETMPIVNKQGGIYKSKGLKKFLSVANDNSAVFSALTAAVFACALRPATIMAMPAKGKNKEDNKYSAAHSISSGLVGAAVALAFNLPISLALKNFAKNPAKFAEKIKGVDVSKGTFGKYLLDAEKHLSDKSYDDGAKLINLGSELLLAIPQALLTTALIPPVLKKLGIQKSSSKAQQASAQQNTTQTTAAQAKDSKKEVSFKGKQVNFEGKTSVWDPLSAGFARLFSTKKFPEVVSKLNGKNSGKNATSIVQKLSTAKSALISGLYVTRTMSNKNLDPDRRTTLAINQASVWGVATILNLTLDKLLNKATEKFVDNYRAANIKDMKVTPKNLEKATTAMNRLNGGIKAAKSLIIVSLVYRYLSPVLVTPIANKIGNFVEANKKAKAQKSMDVAMRAIEAQQTQKSEKV